MTAGASTALTRSDGNASSRVSTDRSRRSLWVGFHSAAPAKAAATTEARPPKEPAVPTEPAAPAEAAVVTQDPPQPPAMVDEAEPSGTPPKAPPEPEAPTPKKSARAEKIELAIDKLPNHELIKPIPVLIESLGDKVFIAEVPGLEISITGNSMGGVLLQLKEHIANIYEGHRASNNLKPESARQLKAMETYIGRTRRNWF